MRLGTISRPFAAKFRPESPTLEEYIVVADVGRTAADDCLTTGSCRLFTCHWSQYLENGTRLLKLVLMTNMKLNMHTFDWHPRLMTLNWYKL